MVKEGRLLPRDQAGLVTVLSALTDRAPLDFAEEGATVPRTARAWIEAFLQRLPVQVDFRERSAGTGADPAAPPPLSPELAAVTAQFGHRVEDLKTFGGWQ